MSEQSDQTETLLGDGNERPAGAASPQLLGNRYLLEERIASGGMASVWRAHDEVLARTVAVKVLHDHLAADEDFRERFRREAIHAAKLTHPHVVGLYDTGTDGDRVYLVMEFVDGVTLRDVIADTERVDPGRAAAIGEKVARALDYAHERGLVHRDVKPANILIGDDGTVKVADFGIAKVAEEGGQQDLTKTGMVLGTAAYIAPEQILGQPITGKADQYALGCVLYEALTGQRAFKAASAATTAAQRLEHNPLPVRSLRTDVPRGLDAVILRAMERSPEDRFPSAGHLADALLAFADADTDPGRTTTMVVPAGPAVPVGPAADHAARASEPRSSFVRTEGRWLAPVVGLLALAGFLVAVGLGTGVLDAPGTIPSLFAEDRTEPETPVATEQPAVELVELPVAALTSYDPQGGNGVENEDQLGNIVDDDPATAWETEGYDTAAFGNLKDGVGFYVDLGQAASVAEVALTTPAPGFAYEIRVADQPAATIAGWEVVANVPAAAAANATELAQPVTTRYLLIWVTGTLQPDGGRFRARVSDLTVTGTPGSPG